ncbi:acyltransferase [Nostoc sp. CENA67]|uniref:Acyltransferase n=1 Tax=Amazonocrinis nigriterrae CENA67 TaxID=2794033 RepID=A0A8J7HYF6_9NOST|nr:acyltransferase family protein [Amazonocrinis nigriterrae]MBH8566535.1 acyltransferase [Amazonocrinis nigriterrae CENA67]
MPISFTKTNPIPFAENYNRLSQTLPAIKGLAILMVVTYHLWQYSKGSPSFFQILAASKEYGFKSLVESLLSTLCLIGEQGVHFFLIASGFGLAASWWQRYQVSKSKSASFSVISFWRRRALRLLPLYWLAHLLALGLVLIKPDYVPYGQEIFAQGGIEVGAAIIASLTTLRNMIFKYYFFLNGAWWYVGLSIQLYLVFPLLIWFGKRWGWSILLFGSLLFSLIYRLLIVFLALDTLTTDILLKGALFPSRLFEFVFGIVVAIALIKWQNLNLVNIKKIPSFYLLIQNLLFERRWLVLPIFLLILGLACHWSSSEIWPILRVPADALIGVGEFCFVFQIMTMLTIPKKWLDVLGNYSYGIFLTHMNIFVGLWTVLNTVISFYWLRLAIVTMITCTLGIIFELCYNWVTKQYLSNKSA